MSANDPKRTLGLIGHLSPVVRHFAHSPLSRKVLGFWRWTRRVLREHMRRREFITLFGGAAVIWPLTARAQKTARIPRIGVLWHAGSAEEEGRYFTGFIQGLRDLGYTDGLNIILEHRFPNEMPDRFRKMAAELVSMNVDVLVSVGSQTAFYVKDATTTIPIVFIFVPDPVGSKFVSSFARPGGNVTGLTNIVPGLRQKYVELLRNALPLASRFAVIASPPTLSPESELRRELNTAASSFGLRLSYVPVRGPEDFDEALTRARRAGAAGIIAPNDPVTLRARRALAQLALKHRLPAMYATREHVDDGGLMSYGANTVELRRRAAAFVDKILKGAKPADLPVEQPTKFEFVINLRTAKALGLTIPPSMLGRADEVIQ